MTRRVKARQSRTCRTQHCLIESAFFANQRSTSPWSTARACDVRLIFMENAPRQTCIAPAWAALNHCMRLVGDDVAVLQTAKELEVVNQAAPTRSSRDHWYQPLHSSCKLHALSLVEQSVLPRRARLVLPDVPLHVIQRGVNHAAIFMDDEGRHLYRPLLRKNCVAHQLAVHVFVLMDNNVQLLVTPASASALAKACDWPAKPVCSALTRGTGEAAPCGKVVSIPVLSILIVRAAVVAAPEDYRWSSVHTHLGQASDLLITLHPLYLALGPTLESRALAYKNRLAKRARHAARLTRQCDYSGKGSQLLPRPRQQQSGLARPDSEFGSAIARERDSDPVLVRQPARRAGPRCAGDPLSTLTGHAIALPIAVLMLLAAWRPLAARVA